MAFWVQLAIIAAQLLLSLLLKPRVRMPRVKDLERVDAEEGKPIPLVYGIAAVTPNIIAWGQTTTGRDVQKGFPATFYYAKMAGLLCQGPVSRIIDVQFNSKSLWLWPVTSGSSASAWREGALGGTDESGIYPDQGRGTQSVIVSTPGFPIERDEAGTVAFRYVEAVDLFGREREQGGVAGELRFHWGLPEEDATDPLLTELLETDGVPRASRLPQQAWIGFGGAEDESIPADRIPGHHFYFGANTGAMPGVQVLLQVLPTALLECDADSDTSDAGYNAGTKTLAERFAAASVGHDANPAEILYDLCTSSVRGLGMLADLLDIDALVTLARECRGEGLGLSLHLADDSDPLDVLEDVLKHVRGVRYVDPRTGLLVFALVRPAEDLAATLELTAANTTERKFTPGVEAQAYNEVRVTFRRIDGQVSGPVVGESVAFPTGRGLAPLVHTQLKGRNVSAVTLYANHGDGSGFHVVDTSQYLVGAEQGILTMVVHDDPWEGGDPTDEVYRGDTLQADYACTVAFLGFRDGITTPAQDLANQQMTGQIRATTLNYPMFTAEFAASRQAAYLLRAAATPGKFSCKVHCSGGALVPGSVVRLTWPEYGLVDYVARIGGAVDYGTLTNEWIEIGGTEDLWAEVPTVALPGGGGAGETPPVTKTAPAMAIGYVASSAIRVALFPSDPTFTVELHRATDGSGAGDTLLSATIAGTAAYYDDAQTVGDTRYYRARLIRSGWTAGAWTPWQAMTAAAGTPTTTPTGTDPTFALSWDDALGTFTVTVTDPDGRLQTVEFRHRSGTGAFTAWTADASAPYTDTVTLDPTYD
jgi:hypothetical protein